jgi:hypothetical protein
MRHLVPDPQSIQPCDNADFQCVHRLAHLGRVCVRLGLPPAIGVVNDIDAFGFVKWSVGSLWRDKQPQNIVDIFLRNAGGNSVLYSGVHAVDILPVWPPRRGVAGVNVDQHRHGRRLSRNIDRRGGLGRPKLGRQLDFVVGFLGEALVDVEALLVGLGKGVDHAPALDGEVLDGHDVGVASRVDDPTVAWQAADALELRVRAAPVHLVAPQVAAVAEVVGVLAGLHGREGGGGGGVWVESEE